MPESLVSTCPDARKPGPWRAARRAGADTLRRLAAPQVTVLCFVLLAAGALWIAEGGAPATTAMAAPLSLLMVNLLASVATHPRFRTDLPLLIFHLALMALIVLFFLGRMTYADGVVPVTRGAVFDGALVQVERGPWHGDGFERLRFGNEGFVDEYPANGNGYLTYNRVRWWDADGGSHVVEIGDDRPLVLDGYRIYANRKGLAPRLLWQRDSGEVEFASMQLGSLEPDGWYEGSAWSLPAGPDIWVGMQHEFERPEPGSRRVDLGVADIDTPLVVRVGDARHQLATGQSLALPGGKLTYVRLDAWMGYRIVYDPTTHWIVGTVALAIASLIWFYVQRVFRRKRPESRA